MTQNTVLGSKGGFPPEYTSGAVPPELSSVALSSAALPPATLSAATLSPGMGDAVILDPVRSLAEAWHREAAADWSVPVRRPFDAQYWACWLVAVVFPVLVAYLLLAR